ncbi:hypothetical protein BD309DRAFT_645500 [Dichomitus squalens]|uniref:Uncharacterized protein n=1 Tax=Dichomitus squalens TaxID=114155 RepID=A0A4Q9PSM7_9APHY|nr:hypothetical protein BD309DRAFT_645500 [Dichomitus squalens]TBU57364.1 hypothetical protein BD310DRAFT_556895 [Dichomitus squalens]
MYVGYRTEPATWANGPERLGERRDGRMHGRQSGTKGSSDEARIAFNTVTQALCRSKSRDGSWAPCLIPTLPHHFSSPGCILYRTGRPSHQPWYVSASGLPVRNADASSGASIPSLRRGGSHASIVSYHVCSRSGPIIECSAWLGFGKSKVSTVGVDECSQGRGSRCIANSSIRAVLTSGGEFANHSEARAAFGVRKSVGHRKATRTKAQVIRYRWARQYVHSRA